MITFQDEDICLLPLYYDHILKSNTGIFEFKTFDDTMKDAVIAIIKNNESNGKITIIDMQFITVYGSGENNRGAFSSFCDFLDGHQIAFLNIQKSPMVLDIILSDFREHAIETSYYCLIVEKELATPEETENWGCCVASNAETYKRFIDAGYLNKIKKLYLDNVIKKIKENCVENYPQFLPSSDIYSSAYIRLKDLFLFPEETRLCTYLLCKLFKDKFYDKRIDGIVSMSNTGAVLANLVGKMLGIDVVFLTNVGPRFALETNDIELKIKKDGNYLYVFDFICLGTEIKNLRSILVCFGANTIGGVGIASLPLLNTLRKKAKGSQEYGSILRKAFPLFALSEYNIAYEISIDGESMEGGGDIEKH